MLWFIVNTVTELCCLCMCAWCFFHSEARWHNILVVVTKIGTLLLQMQLFFVTLFAFLNGDVSIEQYVYTAFFILNGLIFAVVFRPKPIHLDAAHRTEFPLLLSTQVPLPVIIEMLQNQVDSHAQGFPKVDLPPSYEECCSREEKRAPDTPPPQYEKLEIT